MNEEEAKLHEDQEFEELTTLDEHEREFWKSYRWPNTEAKSGIKCPECNEELWVNTTVMLLSNPPQRSVFCKKCGYVGSIH